MCKDRLLLIQKALDVKTYTYKNSQRVCYLLRYLLDLINFVLIENINYENNRYNYLVYLAYYAI